MTVAAISDSSLMYCVISSASAEPWSIFTLRSSRFLRSSWVRRLSLYLRREVSLRDICLTVSLIWFHVFPHVLFVAGSLTSIMKSIVDLSSLVKAMLS